MDQLNYHHLRYFREVATEGNLSKRCSAPERVTVCSVNADQEP
jgi:hypothetical protein